MINKQNIISFIDYNYKPFDKKECIKRILLVWIFSIGLCFFGKENRVWFIFFIVTDIIITVILSILLIKYPKNKGSRFLSDGIVQSFYSVVLNLASYRLITINSEKNILLALLLLSILPICIIIYFILIYHNIKLDKYNAKSTAPIVGILPFLGGLSGILIAGMFLQDAEQESLILIVSGCLLLLSVLMSIGTMNILKLILLKKLNEDKNFLE